MSQITREQVLDSLKNKWPAYVEQFHALSAAEQAKFLEKQGFARFADLIAHVIAWFQETNIFIERKLADPAHKWQPVDVDAFNAEVIRDYSELDENAVLNSFNYMREAMIDLVSALPDEAFKDEAITDWLEADIVGHLEEHSIQ